MIKIDHCNKRWKPFLLVTHAFVLTSKLTVVKQTDFLKCKIVAINEYVYLLYNNYKNSVNIFKKALNVTSHLSCLQTILLILLVFFFKIVEIGQEAEVISAELKSHVGFKHKTINCWKDLS